MHTEETAAAVVAEAPQRRSALTAVLFAVKVGASAALLWLATRNIDFAAAFSSIENVDVWLLAAAPLALLGGTAVNAWRWQRLLAAHGAPMTFGRSFALLLVTVFFNSGLPSTLGGDAARMVYAVRGGAPGAIVIAATILDRFAGYSAVILYAATIVLVQPFGLELPAVWRALVLVLTAAVPAGLMVLVLVNAIPRPEEWVRRATDPSRRGAAAAVARALLPLLRVRIDVRATMTAMVISFPITFSIGVALWALSAATCACGDLDLPSAVAIAGPIMLAVSVPISIAGWGVREVVMVALFALLGLSAEQALVTSVLFGLALFVQGLPGLVLWLSFRSPKREKRESEAV
jgi:uncharacterized protein (TIRG00374 family)